MALFTKLLRSVSCRALPKPLCYEDVRRTTYKATSLYLRFPGLLNSQWLTVCSVREQSHLKCMRQMSYDIIFLLTDLKGSASPLILSPACSHLPSALTDCTGREGYTRGDSRKADLAPRQALAVAARLGGLPDPSR